MIDNTVNNIDQIWQHLGFIPNPEQEQAIKHINHPLFITAGPGSGKTRVLLWRTINLIAFHDVSPDEIFLTTFTEKAARQLREGIRVYLGQISNFTGIAYDISQMYVGTVHSLCQQLLQDRRFTQNRDRADAIKMMDALEQFFFVKNRRRWKRMMEAAEIDLLEITQFFSPNAQFENRHESITFCISLFNRFSEEQLNIEEALNRTTDPILDKLIKMYDEYRKILIEDGIIERCDFSLIQTKTLDFLKEQPNSSQIFKHVIVDEYQDTNPIQEELFFTLAGQKNICVVGDDDQALYRFRGATVQNFIEFPDRCNKFLGVSAAHIPLVTNYRSRTGIVEFYRNYIDEENWTDHQNPSKLYRVQGKQVIAARTDTATAIITTDYKKKEEYSVQVAKLVKQLLNEGKVKDPSQIAFLYPSLKGTHVRPMIEALEAEGLTTYAPRAGSFLQVPEAVKIFGLLMHLLGRPGKNGYRGRDYDAFHSWMDLAEIEAQTIIDNDPLLGKYIQERKSELDKILKDYTALLKVVEQNKWNLQDDFNIDIMLRPLVNATGISNEAKKGLANKFFISIIKLRLSDPKEKNFKLNQIINRVTSVDWSLLDVFYQLCGFEHFKKYFDVAQAGTDEAPIINLGMISRYISRFNEIYFSTLYAKATQENGFQRLFFLTYAYGLYKLGESEYEDADNPFPKGRIPFLTIHQSKGLEFPVVFLYPLRGRGSTDIEEATREATGKTGEPIDRIVQFDKVRMFYVGQSRAENLLIIPNCGKSQPFQKVITKTTVRISNFDTSTLPEAEEVKENALTKAYSYTSDYMLYTRCPRQYMIFRKYNFAPSRSQTMFFGSLVHRTIEDLHQYLIGARNA
jgi:DNA helicase-2/ATP-dependent DNA helicase PcrA